MAKLTKRQKAIAGKIEAGKAYSFEEAATLRDKISSMKGMLERQKIVSASTIDQDYSKQTKRFKENEIFTWSYKNTDQ